MVPASSSGNMVDRVSLKSPSLGKGERRDELTVGAASVRSTGFAALSADRLSPRLCSVVCKLW